MERSENIFPDTISREVDRRERALLRDQATWSRDGIRQVEEPRLAFDYRPAFSVDVDRILHSLAYTRYIDKTQVFYLSDNDHITHRVLHVQLVSKIARTIGRFLGLNTDLIEAIALGHDLGHAPFGHDGEHYLSELCTSHGIGYFRHCAQSVRFMTSVERKGKGWNLCLQTLDGMLCHDGEIHDQILEPKWGKTMSDHNEELHLKSSVESIPLIPMTLEGCVVRMADTIGYIGRDIEDAIRMGIIDRTDIPEECQRVLGRTNGTIVYNLVTDIIKQSFQKTYIAFSPVISDALAGLKAFNLKRIYLHPKAKPHADTIRSLYQLLFERYMEDIRDQRRESAVFSRFLEDMDTAYMDAHSPAEIARDFIAGMTDQYFLSQCPADTVQLIHGRL